MRAPLFIIAASAALLTSCGDKVQCAGDGQIIIPPDASAADRRKWSTENAELALARVRAELDDPGARYARVDKAPSCP